MEIIWGYNTKDDNIKERILNKEVGEIKQIFSAFLFQSGLIGVAIEFIDIIIRPQALLKLIVDEIEVVSNYFSPKEAGIYTFRTEQIIFPKRKIEIILIVEDGEVSIATSALGNGMGFIKENNTFVPTQHFALGLVLN